MKRFVSLAAGVVAALVLAAAQAAAESRSAGVAPLEISAQRADPAVRARPRARLRVYPRYPYRTYSSPYPLAYEIEYPGPGFVRECASRLVPENRPSGTVIVPRMRCWWARR